MVNLREKTENKEWEEEDNRRMEKNWNKKNNDPIIEITSFQEGNQMSPNLSLSKQNKEIFHFKSPF